MPFGTTFTIPESLYESLYAEMDRGLYPITRPFLKANQRFMLEEVECYVGGQDQSRVLFRVVKTNTEFIVPWSLIEGKVRSCPA